VAVDSSDPYPESWWQWLLFVAECKVFCGILNTPVNLYNTGKFPGKSLGAPRRQVGLTAFHKFEDTKAAMEAWKGEIFFFPEAEHMEDSGVKTGGFKHH
jgi:hypothetical protein